MSGQGRYKTPAQWIAPAMLAVVALGATGRLAMAQPARSPDEFLRDAELADVFFIDPDRGWAVGDRGVIWHTEDGGRHWGLQTSAATCRLDSVWFVDDRHGWSVGGWAHPYTHFSTGVVLRTNDGGQTWEVVPRLSLPRLGRVKFQDARNGWAVGESSAMYPAGVFQTNDGGRSWSSVPGAQPDGWLTGDCLDSRTAALGGRCGFAASLRAKGIEPAAAPRVGLRNIRGLRLPSVVAGKPAGPGWLVGDGGLVLYTTDGGGSWQEPLAPLPEGMYDHFDFRAVAVVGERCWMAGAPGSCVLHSADGGRSWTTFETGQTLPLRALTFLDAQRGWAVGALGAILATRDGGRTWLRQSPGSSHAALLGLFAQPQQLPLELLANVAAGDGYLSVVEVLNRGDAGDASRAAASLERRTHDAVVAAGGSQADTAWRFPGRQAGMPLAASAFPVAWSPAAPQLALPRLEEHVVRLIRQWRPEVVVTDAASPRGRDPLAHLVNQTVLTAVERAAEGTAYPQQQMQARLAPWKVGRVYCAAGPETTGALNITTAQLVPRLGCSITDQAEQAWRLLRDQPQPAPQTVGFRLLVNQRPKEDGRNQLFGGAALAPGGDGRRHPSTASSGDLRTITRAAQQRQNVQRLLGQLGRSSSNNIAWLGQVEELLRGVQAGDSADMLYGLAYSLHESGRLELAAQVFDLLVKRNPNHPLCEPALIWLVHYSASSEAKRFTAGDTPPVAATAPAPRPTPRETPPFAVAQAKYEAPVLGPPLPGVRTVGTVTTDAASRTRGPEAPKRDKAAEYVRLIQASLPALYAEPCVRFPAATAERASGTRREAEAFYHAVVGGPTRDAWWPCARAELWLLRPERQPPLPLAKCPKANQRPHLDGRLDDAVWKSCEAILLTANKRVAGTGNPSPTTLEPAEFLLAYDSEFLYLAAHCVKAAGLQYATADATRQRDADLSSQDRVELLLDADRDYTTCFRLTVDHRGWGAESCLGSAAWNPRWFIAATSDDSAWSFEAAIPWTELSARAPEPQSFWAIGVQRIMPGTGCQTWAVPSAAGRVGDPTYGLLKFE